MAFVSCDNNQNDLMTEGDYEVMLRSCELTRTKTSNIECISMDFVVRDDVPQLYKRKHIFKRFYRDNNTGEWPVHKIGKIANALGIGSGSSFELADLVGLCCIVHIAPWAPPGGEMRDTIKYYKPTEVGQMLTFGEAVDERNGELQEVPDDDELPF